MNLPRTRTAARRTLQVISVHRAYLHKDIRQFAAAVGFRWLALDIGSGESPYARYFAVGRYITVDVEARGPLAIRADCQRLPFRDACADLVICTEVLEHVPDFAIALGELARVLRPGGALILTMPLVWGVHERRDFRRLTGTALALALEEYGLTIRRFEHRGGIFSTIAGLVSQVPYQVLGPFDGRLALVRMTLAAVGYLLVAPLVLALRAIDGLDRRRDFTLGYDVLAERTDA